MEYIRTEIERANDHWREQLESLPLYTHTQPAVPEGWKLVPIEPTHEMTEQGAQEADWYAHNAYDCYKAMLDAAPQPPKGGEGDE
jgi:hypothetical protein